MLRATRSRFVITVLILWLAGPALAYEPPEVTHTGSRITEQNDTFWRFAWQVTFYNPNAEKIVLDVEIHWIDADGFVINTHRTYKNEIGPRRSETLRGSTLIVADIAPNVVGFETEAVLY